MPPVFLAIYGLLALALAVSVVTDLRTRKIKDVVTLPTLTLCLLLRLASAGWGDWAGPGLASGLLGALVGGGFFLLLAWMGGMGMGDVKLVAAVGAGVGFPMVVLCLLGIGIAGGVQALVVLLWSGRLLGTLGSMLRGVLRRVGVGREGAGPSEKVYIPYGVAIALGTAWGLWYAWSPGALP